MIESIRSVLVGLTKEFGPEETSWALGYALTLAREAGAHLTVQVASERIHLRNQDANRTIGSLVGAANDHLRHLAKAATEAARSEAVATGVVVTVHAPHLRAPELFASFISLAHAQDFAVLDAEPEAIHPDRTLIQALLMESGRPLLVVPSGWHAFRAERILIAWDGSGRASRAVHDALPFLRAAQAVHVVVATDEKELPALTDGFDLAPHLTRHGVPVEVGRVAVQGGDVAEALRNEAERHGADLIVMGAYVHSRLRQLVFGGVTQSLLRSSPVPLLMSY